VVEKRIRRNGGAFLQGSQANNYAANSTNCFNRGLNFWFTELLTLQWRYFYGNTDDNVFNSTRQLSNLTNTMMVCFDTLENMSVWATQRYALFPDFTTMFMGFFQNLLGSITQMISIYKNINKAIEADDRPRVYLEMGKIFRILIDFQPIETESLSFSSDPSA
jgi:hypothetical protein